MVRSLQRTNTGTRAHGSEHHTGADRVSQTTESLEGVGNSETSYEKRKMKAKKKGKSVLQVLQDPQ